MDILMMLVSRASMVCLLCKKVGPIRKDQHFPCHRYLPKQAESLSNHEFLGNTLYPDLLLLVLLLGILFSIDSNNRSLKFLY